MLRLHDLVCAHGDRQIIHVPQLDIEDGKVLAVVGRSGAGKSTLLSTLSGDLPAQSGQILMDSQPVARGELKHIAVRTIQSFPLLHWLTVKGNLKTAARMRRINLTDEKVEEILRLYSAGHLIHRFPMELSGGERARASLAQAAIGKPRLLLLDEPLTGLDPVVRGEVAESLFGFARNLNAAVLFVTHELSDASMYAHRVAVLSRADPSRITDVFSADESGLHDKLIAAMT